MKTLQTRYASAKAASLSGFAAGGPATASAEAWQDGFEAGARHLAEVIREHLLGAVDVPGVMPDGDAAIAAAQAIIDLCSAESGGPAKVFGL